MSGSYSGPADPLVGRLVRHKATGEYGVVLSFFQAHGPPTFDVRWHYKGTTRLGVSTPGYLLQPLHPLEILALVDEIDPHLLAGGVDEDGGSS